MVFKKMGHFGPKISTSSPYFWIFSKSFFKDFVQ